MNGTETYQEFQMRRDYLQNENPQGDARKHELDRLAELISRMTGPSQSRYQKQLDDLHK